MALSRSARALTAAAVATPTLFLGPVVQHEGVLTDLQPPGVDAPTDGARASVVAVASRSGTLVVLRLRGLDEDAAGQRYGAHVHVGHCVAGEPLAAGGHYNHATATGTAPSPDLSDDEVWLDFTVRPGGTAHAIARVPFTVRPGGAHSVVVHELPTHPDTGAAGGRLACLPVHL